VIRTSGDMQPCLELRQPWGGPIIQCSIDGNFTDIWTYLNGGLHTIVVSDSGNDGTGSYNLLMQKVNNPCNLPNITCGQTIPGLISAVGEQDFYTFKAGADDANDPITIRAIH
jgi:hypothetical protein